MSDEIKPDPAKKGEDMSSINDLLRQIRDTPVVPPEPEKAGLLQRLINGVSRKYVEYAILLGTVFLLGKLGIILPPPVVPDGPIFYGAEQANGPLPNFDNPGEPFAPSGKFGGWVSAPKVVEEIRSQLPNAWFADTPAGRAFLGPENDVYLWTAAKQVLGKNLENRNQLQVGSCVSFGTGSAWEHLLLIQIASGKGGEFKPVSHEALYALMRVEIGGGRISGDGAVGSWGAEAGKRFGYLPAEKIGNYDLTTYDQARCRDWGRKGLPKELEPIAKQSPIKSYTFIRTLEELDKALAQGYPVAECSNWIGRTGKRDAEGYAVMQNQGGHCQAVLGKRTDGKGGYFIWNSWGANTYTGPKGPGDPPEGGYWVTPAEMNRIVTNTNNEVIAFSDAVGFPARKLDWLVNRDDNRRNQKQNQEFAFARRGNRENFDLLSRPAVRALDRSRGFGQ